MLETWLNNKSDFPGGERSRGVAVTVGGRGYAGLGVNGSTYKSDWYSYNPTTDSWDTLTSFPGAARADAIAIAVGTIIYVGCGRDGGMNYRNWYKYNTADNTWTAISDIPEAGATAYYGQAIFAVGSKVFVCCGMLDADVTKHCYKLDTLTDTWTAIADFSGDGRYYCAGFSIGSLGFIVGGILTGAAYTKETWEYNPVSETWTQKGNFKETIDNTENEIAKTTAISIGMTGYIVTGNDSAAVSDAFASYSPASGAWTGKTDFPYADRQHAFVFVVNSCIYVCCGDNGAGGYATVDLCKMTFSLDAPTNCIATIVDKNHITITWNDNSSEESGYIVERKRSDQVDWSVLEVKPAGSTSHTDNTVDLENYAYWYRVKAFKS